MAILTTVILSLNALTDAIADTYNDVTIRYDPSLDYESGEQIARSQSRYEDRDSNSDNRELPLLLFNRSSLRRAELGGRGPSTVYGSDEDRTKLDLDTFTCIHGEYDFRFLYIDKNIESMERFEVDYISNNMIAGIQDCTVDLSGVDLGEWKYYVTWNPQLDDFTANSDNSSYVSISGSATVRGYFLSMTGTTPVIASINTKIFDKQKQLIEQFNTPKEN